MRRLDAARQRLARGRLRARVGGHERQLVVIVEALDRVRRRRLAADRSGQARVVGVRLREAPALAVEGVGRVLVLARIDGEAGRGVVEVARELLVHLEGDLPPPPLLLIPAVAEQPVRRRALAEGACRVDLGRLVVVVRTGVAIAAVLGLVAPDQVGERQLHRGVRARRPVQEVLAGEDHGLGVALGRRRRIGDGQRQLAPGQGGQGERKEEDRRRDGGSPVGATRYANQGSHPCSLA